jgi:hypothetical protein
VSSLNAGRRRGPGATTPWERLRHRVLVAAESTSDAEPAPPSPHADDRERLIALVAAPVTTAVAILSVRSLVAADPTGRGHVPVQDYDAVLVVLLALAGAMIGFGLWRKRLFVGMAMSLAGLTLFNLHQWGFGVPFVMAGAWYLVRAYRSHRNEQADASATAHPMAPAPAASKRYTPPGAGRGPARRHTSRTAPPAAAAANPPGTR